MKISKKWLAMALAAGMMAVAAGCGSGGGASSAPAKSTASKNVAPLKVATEAAYPPFRYKDEDGHIVGFEVDLANAIGKELGRPVEFVDMNFTNLLDAVNDNKVDMSMGAITITTERAKKVDFSNPYYNLSGYSVVVKKGDRSIRHEADLAGKIVATKTRSTSENRVKALNPARVVSYDHYAGVFNAVETGGADVAVGADMAAKYYLEHGGSELLTVAGNIPTNDNFAIAFKKDNDQLKNDVDNALDKIMRDGTYEKISQKWFFDQTEKQQK